ncbi:response regulator, partial [Bacteroidota bacterium]
QIPSEEVIRRIVIMMFIVILSAAYFAWYHFRSKALKKTNPIIESDDQGHGLNPDVLSAILNQIRMSLQIIVGFADLFKNHELEPTTKDLYAKYIYDNSAPNLLMVENIIDLFTIESGQLSIDKKACNLEELFEELFLDIDFNNLPNPTKHRVPNLIRVGHTEELIINTDCNRLKQVLLNLLTNAHIFSTLPKIEIGFTIEKKFLKFYIIDDVKGLSIDSFDEFFSKRRSEKGIRNQSLIIAVLRMKIAKELVKILGGKLWISLKSGVPAATYFTIPIEIIYQPIEVDIPGKQSEIPNWGKYHILIVEDLKINYLYLAEVVKPTKIQITWAKNGKEAVELTGKSNAFDIVLMDILMPEMDGFEAAKLVKEINKNLPIIAQTAYSLDGESENTLSNFDGFLTKPIWSKDLVGMLSNFLN